MDTTHFRGFSRRILRILLQVNLEGLSFNIFFSKRAVQMFVRNVGWLQIAVGDLWFHSTAPGKNTVKQNSEEEFQEKFRRIGNFFREQI